MTLRLSSWLLAAVLLSGCTSSVADRPSPQKDYPIQAVPFTDVKVVDAFWSPRMETNRTISIPYAFKMCEETGRIDNFAIAGKLKEGKFRGIFFNDSDVFKVIEGASYALAIHRDAELEKYVDDVIAKIAAAQEPDGYLYTARTLMTADYSPPGGKERWSDIGSGHELYNVGHLYEAAVAYHLATGKRTLLDVAIRNADLVCSVFGPTGKQNPPGHQEIEIGLVKLYRLTGDEKYLRQARFFLDARGRADGHRLYGAYSQDHKPVVEQAEAVGHSVRAGYLYTGMADVAALMGDAAYVNAIGRIWEDVVGRKLYITGGIGARGGGEAFGDAYELPNRTAYAETCAAIANALWNQRMFLMHGDGKYIDVLERTIYNGFLSGVGMEGNRFFYPNPLEAHSSGQRAPWFDCACCPSNVVRFVPSIPGYVYAHRDNDLYVNLFIGGSATVNLPGNRVQITQETRYPWEGTVKIGVAPRNSTRFAVMVRIPGWAAGKPVPSDLYRYEHGQVEAVSLKVNGEAMAFAAQNGFARIERTWKRGDTIELSLPMPVRRVAAHASVKDDEGRIALERGPIVFCAEGIDQPDGRVLSLVVPEDAQFTTEFKKDLLNGVTVLHGKAAVVRRSIDGKPTVDGEQALTAIPYHAWAHRQNGGQMAVWLPSDVKAAKPLPGPTVAYTSKVTVSAGGPVSALADQLEPRNSIDHGNPFFHWWPRKGTSEWVQYDFAKPTRVSGVEVYWFDDTGIGECRLPATWRVLAKVNGDWKPVSNASGYGVEKDKYNRTTFDAVEAEGLKLEVQLPERFAAGIHEWRVLPAAAAVQQPAPSPPVAARNFVPNPSFEQASRDNPRSWRREQWGGQGAFEYATVGRTGQRSVMISSERGADIGWAATVTVEPYSQYRLSGWIKTEDVKATNGRGALFNLHGMEGVATPAVTGTSDWKQVEVVFDTEEQDSIQVNCLFGGWGQATGKAWYDDLKLERIGGKEIPKPSIRIDMARKGEPISPFIYGQFIEHLGRCIYGGIWAEMLEDRKFWHAVGDRASPWRMIGGEGTVVMSKDKPFVGQHTPEIKPSDDATPRGMVHGGLGLMAGKDYVGRIWLAGGGTAGPVKVSLIWGDAPSDRQTITIDKLTGEYQKHLLKFTSKARTDNGRLEITSTGKGGFRVGTLSLMPADNVQGMRPDTLALLKELDSPVYRWPGGNFVSGYDWKDGIGDPDRRPPRKNPAWQGVEHNDMGLDEFMVFCRILDTEPYIAVNSGLGDVKSAVEEVEYANGAANTPMGRWRAKNGHPEPYKVKFWSIGNEMYGSWQLGNMPLERYIQKHNEFAVAMRKADPTVQLIGVGAVGAWSEGMMKNCADHMELISEHFYSQERPGLNAHVKQIPDNIRNIANAHRRYRQQFESLKGKDIRIALDEWNYWYGPHVFGELGTRYFLKDGLGIAAGLHEYARNSDIYYMANYAQTVNVIGCIKTSKTAAEFETTGLVLKLYRKHFGTVPLATATTGLLDATAALSDDGKILTIGVVNPTMQRQEIPMQVDGRKVKGSGTRWQIAGQDPMAYNDPGSPAKVKIEQAQMSGIGEKLTVDPCSVTLFALELE